MIIKKVTSQFLGAVILTQDVMQILSDAHNIPQISATFKINDKEECPEHFLTHLENHLPILKTGFYTDKPTNQIHHENYFYPNEFLTISESKNGTEYTLPDTKLPYTLETVISRIKRQNPSNLLIESINTHNYQIEMHVRLNKPIIQTRPEDNTVVRITSLHMTATIHTNLLLVSFTVPTTFHELNLMTIKSFQKLFRKKSGSPQIAKRFIYDYQNIMCPICKEDRNIEANRLFHTTFLSNSFAFLFIIYPNVFMKEIKVQEAQLNATKNFFTKLHKPTPDEKISVLAKKSWVKLILGDKKVGHLCSKISKMPQTVYSTELSTSSI